jgi:hypothetical protein
MIDTALTLSPPPGEDPEMTAPMLKIPQPPLFDGTRDVDVVDRWFYRMEMYFCIASVVDGLKLDMATCFLGEDAITWYLANQSSIMTYEEFETQMRNYFLPSNYIPLILVKFKKLTQSQLHQFWSMQPLYCRGDRS